MKTKIQILFFFFLGSIIYAQSFNKEVIVLKTWEIKKANEYPVKTKFSYTENGRTSYFYYELSKKWILLKDGKTKKVIRKYMLNIPSPNLTCEEQEKKQWDDFNDNIYPSLLNAVNASCNPSNYCLQINCNGNPTTFIMIMIKPTSKRCKWINATLKTEIKKYNFNLHPF